LGRTFIGKVRLYVSALGEKWPKIKAAKEG